MEKIRRENTITGEEMRTEKKKRKEKRRYESKGDNEKKENREERKKTLVKIRLSDRIRNKSIRRHRQEKGGTKKRTKKT